jgi:DegV family protein with EDD domain
MTKKKVAIVTDGISSMTQEMAREHGIHMLPIYVMFGTDSYLDGVDLDSAKFYSLLRGNKDLPTTSQPTIMDFVKVYRELAPQYEAIVSIHASKKVSATIDSARAAAKEVTEVPIHVIDTQTLTLAQGQVAIAAARAADEGQSAEEIVQLVQDLAPKTNVIFTVETLEYLRKGGRIGAATALLGSALRVKPLLHIDDGQVAPLEKPRTRKKAVGRLLDLVEERVGTSGSISAAVLHCDVPQDAQRLAEQISARFNCAELVTADAGPVIGTHAGPGTLGIAFYSNGTG